MAVPSGASLLPPRKTYMTQRLPFFNCGTGKERFVHTSSDKSSFVGKHGAQARISTSTQLHKKHIVFSMSTNPFRTPTKRLAGLRCPRKSSRNVKKTARSPLMPTSPSKLNTRNDDIFVRQQKEGKDSNFPAENDILNIEVAARAQPENPPPPTMKTTTKRQRNGIEAENEFNNNEASNEKGTSCRAEETDKLSSGDLSSMIGDLYQVSHTRPQGILRTSFREAWIPPSTPPEKVVRFTRNVSTAEQSPVAATGPPAYSTHTQIRPSTRCSDYEAPSDPIYNTLAYGPPWAVFTEQENVHVETVSPPPVYVPSPSQRVRGDIAWGWPWVDRLSPSSSEYHAFAADDYEDNDGDDNNTNLVQESINSALLCTMPRARQLKMDPAISCPQPKLGPRPSPMLTMPKLCL
ncbi:hypothetical protein M406DRAFT_75549 [Cryphonectria parasitica EP155]|uniref:Uncharacterized protein n=1 Tax=Cryphonectria parasitica (strain ATCC 38755 / EP155) TaxID=660469 RepID=A0A9P4XSS9_CRYP1|nr:uncharacterized protein M406DRAFT_75549 [Cryphonectria parasitica EP155]KAF3760288.1 hypothetical protein M406DRAFT_75549 [Cryphonectria parasitica EP155]